MKLHIGNEIARIQKLRGISNEVMAEHIHTSVRNVHHIKKKEDVSTSQLFAISELLNYNFFKLFEPVIVDPMSEQREAKPGKEEKMLAVNFNVRYPLSRADELGKFMQSVNAIGDKMGFELI